MGSPRATGFADAQHVSWPFRMPHRLGAVELLALQSKRKAVGTCFFLELRCMGSTVHVSDFLLLELQTCSCVPCPAVDFVACSVTGDSQFALHASACPS